MRSIFAYVPSNMLPLGCAGHLIRPSIPNVRVRFAPCWKSEKYDGNFFAKAIPFVLLVEDDLDWRLSSFLIEAGCFNPCLADRVDPDLIFSRLDRVESCEVAGSRGMTSVRIFSPSSPIRLAQWHPPAVLQRSASSPPPRRFLGVCFTAATPESTNGSDIIRLIRVNRPPARASSVFALRIAFPRPWAIFLYPFHFLRTQPWNSRTMLLLWQLIDTEFG